MPAGIVRLPESVVIYQAADRQFSSLSDIEFLQIFAPEVRPNLHIAVDGKLINVAVIERVAHGKMSAVHVGNGHMAAGLNRERAGAAVVFNRQGDAVRDHDLGAAAVHLCRVRYRDALGEEHCTAVAHVEIALTACDGIFQCREE